MGSLKNSAMEYEARRLAAANARGFICQYCGVTIPFENVWIANGKTCCCCQRVIDKIAAE